MADSVNLRNLKKKYLENKIEEKSCFIIDKNLYGGLFVIGAIFGVKPVTVKDWLNEGLVYSDFKVGSIHLIKVKTAVDWYRENKRQSFARNKEKPKGKPIALPSQKDVEKMMNPANLEDLTQHEQDYLDKLKTIEDIHTKRIKRKEAEGLLVNADDLDKAMSEQATIHLSDIANDEKVLPTILSNKSEQEIDIIFKQHKLERKKMIEKVVNKAYRCEETIIDVVQSVLKKMAENIEPDEIIRRIEKNS